MYCDSEAIAEYSTYLLAQQYKKTHGHIRGAINTDVQHIYAQKDLELIESS